jgi:hypothetical protein
MRRKFVLLEGGQIFDGRFNQFACLAIKPLKEMTNLASTELWVARATAM